MVTPRGNEVEETPEKNQQLPTAEERLKELEAKLAAEIEARQKAEGSYKGLQRTLNEKDNQLKKQTTVESRIDELQDTIEVLATAIARGEQSELDTTNQASVLETLRKERDKQKVERAKRTEEETRQDYARRADEIWNRAKAVYGDDDEAVERIEDFLMNGRIDRAIARIEKAEQGKGQGTTETPKGGKKETEEERINRLAEEKYKKRLEEEGLLEEHNTLPSASTTSARQAMSDYIAGKITAEEAGKRGAIFY